MDVSLTFAQMLRAEGVVSCFVECFGEGLESLNATQRACISNMTPEYGATCTLFPVDQKTLDYLELTGRSAEQIALVESYAKAQGFWNDPQREPRTYSKVLELDLSKVQRSVAGPSRPHDRIDLADVKNRFNQLCGERSLDPGKKVSVDVSGHSYEITHGALAIAAVTSCTTATDASMMISAGVLARNASKAGLRPKPWVKTILAPGSRATEDILDAAGLMPALRDLGFYTCGFGCMSCIGNSGPVLPGMHDIAVEVELASVLSGNRNFEGRIRQMCPRTIYAHLRWLLPIRLRVRSILILKPKRLALMRRATTSISKIFGPTKKKSPLFSGRAVLGKCLTERQRVCSTGR